ncbi:transposase [Cupriavidus taiwanensis]|uniref:Transposase n=2 Tax=Cupriavidus taiwanensis TaxID=164546 RepID=A0A375JFW2_9BURK|nr:transposase [Cupriavidus taiwanensis]
MSKHRRPYAKAFRQQMVDLVLSGRSPADLAKEFEPTAETIFNWMAQAEREASTRYDGLTSAERHELIRLRSENLQLKIERQILARAAGCFAPECHSSPDKGTNSG